MCEEAIDAGFGPGNVTVWPGSAESRNLTMTLKTKGLGLKVCVCMYVDFGPLNVTI